MEYGCMMASVSLKRIFRLHALFEAQHLTKKAVYGEIFKLQTDIKILVDGHLMIEFKKINEAENVSDHLKSKHKEFGIT